MVGTISIAEAAAPPFEKQDRLKSNLQKVQILISVTKVFISKTIAIYTNLFKTGSKLVLNRFLVHYKSSQNCSQIAKSPRRRMTDKFLSATALKEAQLANMHNCLASSKLPKTEVGKFIFLCLEIISVTKLVPKKKKIYFLEFLDHFIKVFLASVKVKKAKFFGGILSVF